MTTQTQLYAGRYSDQLVDDFGNVIDGVEVYGDKILDYPEGDAAECDRLIALGMAGREAWS